MSLSILLWSQPVTLVGTKYQRLRFHHQYGFLCWFGGLSASHSSPEILAAFAWNHQCLHVCLVPIFCRLQCQAGCWLSKVSMKVSWPSLRSFQDPQVIQRQAYPCHRAWRSSNVHQECLSLTWHLSWCSPYCSKDHNSWRRNGIQYLLHFASPGHHQLARSLRVKGTKSFRWLDMFFVTCHVRSGCAILSIKATPHMRSHWRSWVPY